MSREKTIYETKIITKDTDAEGNQKVSETTTTIKASRVDEPDYIKLYTNMWCEFKNIPKAYRTLFFSLVTKMSYCNLKKNDMDENDIATSQIVNTGKPWSEQIIRECGWSTKIGTDGRMKGQISLDKGLASLCKHHAIRRVGRGVYQINPTYAGKGEWKYNPSTKHGGITNLIATFDFVNDDVKTKVEFTDDGDNTDYNKMWRNVTNTKPENAAVVQNKTYKTKADSSILDIEVEDEDAVDDEPPYMAVADDEGNEQYRFADEDPGEQKYEEA